jgi:hypothetical protein
MEKPASIQTAGEASLTAPGIYADYIKTLVDSEDARKSSLEQRGVGIVTTSSALATLLFALVGVVTASKNFTLPTEARGYLVAAIVLFAAAVAVGILANIPILYKQATPTADDLADVWDYSDSEAQAYVIATRLKILDSARNSNTVKGLLVLLAGVVQLAALVVLVFGVLAILSGNPHPVNTEHPGRPAAVVRLALTELR